MALLANTKETPRPSTDTTPLYADSELLSHAPRFPSKTAPPDEIRDFLAHQLITARGLPDAHVQGVVARWTVGSGLELRQYGAGMFLEIFGREDGWVIFREVKVRAWREKGWWVRWAIELATLVSVVWEAVMVVLLSVEVSEGVVIFAAFGALFGAIAVLVTFIMLCAGTSAQKQIERELRAATKTVRPDRG